MNKAQALFKAAEEAVRFATSFSARAVTIASRENWLPVFANVMRSINEIDQRAATRAPAISKTTLSRSTRPKSSVASISNRQKAFEEALTGALHKCSQGSVFTQSWRVAFGLRNGR